MSRTRPIAVKGHPIAVKSITAAAMLDCTRSHIYKLVEAGELRAIKLPSSRAVRIPVVDIYALLGLEAPEGGRDDAA